MSLNTTPKRFASSDGPIPIDSAIDSVIRLLPRTWPSLASGRLFQDGRGVRIPFGVQVGLAVVCVGLAVAYFVAALAALSVPPGTPWRVWAVGVAYLLLREVLGASFAMPWRLLHLEKGS